MIYRIAPLPYDYGALEPYIDARTMEIHHARLHASYVEGLNRVLRVVPKLDASSLEHLIADIRAVPEGYRQAVRNFGGGHLNHSLFWHIMRPPAAREGPRRGDAPSGLLLHALRSAFGGVEKFKQRFTEAAADRFGAGWAWLAVDDRGEFEVLSTPNQDSPIMLGFRPILGLDLWEHAYYLKYQDHRDEYIAAWWNVVDWDRVAELYGHCIDAAGRANRR